MQPAFIISFLILACCCSCGRSNNINPPAPTSKDSVNKENTKTPLAQKLVPVTGYRFVISGDFDGDGKRDTLTEHFVSSIDHKETCKFYENADYDTLVSLNRAKKPVSFLACDDKRIDDLVIDSRGHSLGLAYLKNEGDLNGDGTDEISYVADWADLSNTNWCTVMTYNNKKWKELYSFDVRDWQLPDQPQTYNQYGLIGLEDKIINTKDTVANKEIEKNLRDFGGFIKKIANNKIQIVYINDEAEVDTTIIDIRKHRAK